MSSRMDWDTFTDALAEELAALPGGALAVISEPGTQKRGRYVQVAQSSSELKGGR
ncbi:TY-Chap domain-containing protein [Streptomyces sp. 8N114]|uniref:TY-Chap domain-containing protein n=1 Tax=Streptomyces sp. 8N114 TaxID=3457419 RepID=UPI003FCFA81C